MIFTKGFFLIEFVIYTSILSFILLSLTLCSFIFHDSLVRSSTIASNESAGTEILASLEEQFDEHLPLNAPGIILESTTTVINSKTINTFSFTYNGDNFSFTKMTR